LVLVANAPLAKTLRLNVWNASYGLGAKRWCASDKAPVDEGKSVSAMFRTSFDKIRAAAGFSAS
jgi:hypothetical protein